ncbi:MAG: BACON domain-containing protein, partial [Blastocatellia bacterium]
MNGNSLRSAGRFYKRHRLSLISCGLLLCLAVLAGLYTNYFSTIIQRAFAARPFISTQSDRPSLATKTAPASDAIWREVSPRADGATAKQSSQSAPRLFRLDTEAITNILKSAPLESPSSRLENSQTILTLPLPDGTTARFRIQESPIMESSLAARFPEIKSYRGRGVDDPTTTLRFDWSPRGLHGLVLSRNKAFSILPQKTGDIANYLVTDAAEFTDQLRCEVNDSKIIYRRRSSAPEPNVAVGNILRTYRIAVATTQEYTNDPALGGGTQAGAIASINSWLNQVNAIYERELSVRLTLIASNINVVFTAEPDGFTNGSASAMVDQARTVMKNNFATTAYDIGHALGTGASGTAYIGVTCDSTDDGPGPFKAGGVSLVSSPVGGSANVGLIAHEIGHQFSATHTHNAAAGSCAASRTAASAYEPGSGSTIMSHAGVCGAENITGARELRFHAGSFEQISSYITGAPGVCSTNTSTGNNLPTVNGGADRVIPRNTPFTLTATGDDIDSSDFSNLTYVWEQIDAGGAFGNPPYSDAGDGPTTTRPIFRPFTPSLSLSRTFPSPTYILNNANVPPPTVNGFQTAENLSNGARSLNFRVTIRDNRGGVNDDSVLLNIDGNSGPFLVTAPNTAVSWTAGSAQTVTWSVNNTNLAPVNCANVKITLSTDGGATFPHVLSASTPNDGSEAVTLPTGVIFGGGTTARVKVEAVGNIFFDISDTNFTILPAGSCPIATGVSPLAGPIGGSVTITGMNFTGVNAVKFWSEEPASFTVNSDTQITATVAFASVNGPITITKPSCPDAQTSSFVVTSGTPVTLANDDGTYESSFNHGVTGATSWYVTRLTPASYPATLSHVNIYFAPFTNITVGTPITVVAGANADGDADINGTSFLTTNVTVNALNQFNSYAVTPVTINSGDFVVGFSIAHNSAVFPGLLDTTSPNPGRSYASTNGTSFTLVENLGGGVIPGDLAIRGQVYTGNNCAISISPQNDDFPASGGSDTVVVSAGPGCSWAATSNASWITIISGAQGSGNGTVQYSVAANTGLFRTGTMTVAGYTLTVTQDTGCGFTLNPTAQNFTTSGGTGSVAVGMTSTCPWTAAAVNRVEPSFPQAFLNTTYVPPTGTTTFVAAGANLQAAINAAQPGDVLELEAGATFTGNFTLPAKSGSDWIIIRSSAPDSSLPPPGVRVTPSYASVMPKLVTPNNQAALSAADGAQHYRLIGIEFAIAPAVTQVFNLVLFGAGQTSLAQLPHNLILDRVYIHGNSTVQLRRGVALNSASTAIIDSHISDCHEEFADSQAIMCWNGSGPFKIVNNYLEGAAENVLFGGDDPTIPNLVPSDIEFRRNHLFKPLTWKPDHPSYGGKRWVVKNLFELKNAQRVLIDGNIFENNWLDGQTGYAILFTVRNQDGGAPWSAVQDVTFTNNIVRHSSAGLNMHGEDNNFPSAKTRRVRISNNLFDDINPALWRGGPGNFLQINAGPSEVTVEHNTAFQTNSVLVASNLPPGEGLTFTNNLAPNNEFGVFGSDKGQGTVALNYYFPGYIFRKNVLVAGLSNDYPADNFFPPAMAAVGFVDFAGGNYRLAPSSPYKNAGTDGRDIGVDFDALNAAFVASAPPAPPASMPQWITITAGASGSGPGTVSYSIAPNTGLARTGTIVIAGRTFTVMQEGVCAYTISPSSQIFAAGAGSGSVSVTSGAGCDWTATSNAAWITITSGSSGSGSGAVQFSVAANTGGQRTGTMTIAGQTFTVTQNGGCVFTTSPTSQSVVAAGGTGSVSITTTAGCAWIATSNAAWITITAGASGSGNGTTQFSVATNTGLQRTGTITIADQTFTVTQASGCAGALSPTTQNAPASGGSGSVDVAIATGCAWTAASNAAWITITAGASGSGPGTTNFSVAANTGPQRAGTMTIAGQTFTVTQASGCLFSINPASQSFTPSGGSGSVNVTSATGCAWTAVSNDSWITITAGASGSGPGTTNFSVAINTGVPRTGSLTVAGQTFTVTQASGCAFIISPMNQNFTASGGSGSVSLTTTTGCAWTAASNDVWITITAGASGSGSGAVQFSVGANPGPQRTGTMTVAGQTFTVTQNSGCSFSISPTSQSFTTSGGAGSATVTSATGCPWTATSNDSWITITSGGSGSGNGTAQFSVTANTGLQRTGTMTIAGQTFTVTQSSGCSFSINPTSQTFTASGGTGGV